jgi:glycerol-3-phosphate dehydrogenase
MRRDLSALAAVDFDLVGVGGGICGAATAWDAAQRGLAVALVERGDFSGATSAESLKVVHGGIRYLQHLDVVLVRESSRERSALLRIAPHLVHPLEECAGPVAGELGCSPEQREAELEAVRRRFQIGDS